MAELFDALARANTILIDWSRDVWGYVSLGYFTAEASRPARSARARCRTRSTRSTSRMPKATSAWPMRCSSHLSQKLPISRFQRDLTDSTVLRNMGVALGHTLLGYDSAAARHGQARGRPRRARGRPRRRLGSARRADPDRHAPLRPAEPLRAAEGADARQGDHARGAARLHRDAGDPGCRACPPAGADAGRLHRRWRHSWHGASTPGAQ